MADRAPPGTDIPRRPPSDGVDPHRWYDSTQFCELLDIAKNRRLDLLGQLRDCQEAIPNGHSFIAEGIVLLRLYKEVAK